MENVIFGNSTKVITDNEVEFNVRNKIVECDCIIASHATCDNFVVTNPNYPAELQPRDRTNRVILEQKIFAMANKLRVLDLVESRNVNQGAPIVRNDNVVLNGNGRFMAIALAYKTMVADKYKSFLIENAAKLGFKSVDVYNFKNPILVREVMDDLTAENIKSITQATAGGVAFGAREQAQIDAQNISLQAFEYFKETEGDLSAPQNRDFVLQVLEDITNSNDLNAYVTDKGTISILGILRVKHALLAAAYNDTCTLARMTESTDDNIKRVSNALIDIAPKIVVMNQKISNGYCYKYDLSKTIVDAANKLVYLRIIGESVADYLKATCLFNEYDLTAESKYLLQIFDKYKHSCKKINGILTEIVNIILKQGGPGESRLFEVSNPLSLMQVIKGGEQKYLTGNMSTLFEAENNSVKNSVTDPALDDTKKDSGDNTPPQNDANNAPNNSNNNNSAVTKDNPATPPAPVVLDFIPKGFSKFDSSPSYFKVASLDVIKNFIYDCKKSLQIICAFKTMSGFEIKGPGNDRSLSFSVVEEGGATVITEKNIADFCKYLGISTSEIKPVDTPRPPLNLKFQAGFLYGGTWHSNFVCYYITKRTAKEVTARFIGDNPLRPNAERNFRLRFYDDGAECFEYDSYADSNNYIRSEYIILPNSKKAEMLMQTDSALAEFLKEYNPPIDITSTAIEPPTTDSLNNNNPVTSLPTTTDKIITAKISKNGTTHIDFQIDNGEIMTAAKIAENLCNAGINFDTSYKTLMQAVLFGNSAVIPQFGDPAVTWLTVPKMHGPGVVKCQYWLQRNLNSVATAILTGNKIEKNFKTLLDGFNITVINALIADIKAGNKTSIDDTIAKFGGKKATPPQKKKSATPTAPVVTNAVIADSLPIIKGVAPAKIIASKKSLRQTLGSHYPTFQQMLNATPYQKAAALIRKYEPYIIIYSRNSKRKCAQFLYNKDKIVGIEFNLNKDIGGQKPFMALVHEIGHHIDALNATREPGKIDWESYYFSAMQGDHLGNLGLLYIAAKKDIQILEKTLFTDAKNPEIIESISKQGDFPKIYANPIFNYLTYILVHYYLPKNCYGINDICCSKSCLAKFVGIFADIVRGITGNKYLESGGHTLKYYTKRNEYNVYRNVCAEIFAHCLSVAVAFPNFFPLFQKFFPNVTATFDAALNKILGTYTPAKNELPITPPLIATTEDFSADIVKFAENKIYRLGDHYFKILSRENGNKLKLISARSAKKVTSVNELDFNQSAEKILVYSESSEMIKIDGYENLTAADIFDAPAEIAPVEKTATPPPAKSSVQIPLPALAEIKPARIVTCTKSGKGIRCKYNGRPRTIEDVKKLIWDEFKYKNPNDRFPLYIDLKFIPYCVHSRPDEANFKEISSVIWYEDNVENIFVPVFRKALGNYPYNRIDFIAKSEYEKEFNNLPPTNNPIENPKTDPLANIDVNEYAVNPAAFDVATQAEIDNANNANVESDNADNVLDEMEVVIKVAEFIKDHTAEIKAGKFDEFISALTAEFTLTDNLLAEIFKIIDDIFNEDNNDNDPKTPTAPPAVNPATPPARKISYQVYYSEKATAQVAAYASTMKDNTVIINTIKVKTADDYYSYISFKDDEENNIPSRHIAPSQISDINGTYDYVCQRCFTSDDHWLIGIGYRYENDYCSTNIIPKVFAIDIAGRHAEIYNQGEITIIINESTTPSPAVNPVETPATDNADNVLDEMEVVIKVAEFIKDHTAEIKAGKFDEFISALTAEFTLTDNLLAEIFKIIDDIFNEDNNDNDPVNPPVIPVNASTSGDNNPNDINPAVYPPTNIDEIDTIIKIGFLVELHINEIKAGKFENFADDLSGNFLLDKKIFEIILKMTYDALNEDNNSSAGIDNADNATAETDPLANIDVNEYAVNPSASLWFNKNTGRLPANYGKKDYNELTAAERRLVDSYEGKDSYNELHRNYNAYNCDLVKNAWRLFLKNNPIFAEVLADNPQ